MGTKLKKALPNVITMIGGHQYHIDLRGLNPKRDGWVISPTRYAAGTYYKLRFRHGKRSYTVTNFKNGKFICKNDNQKHVPEIEISAAATDDFEAAADTEKLTVAMKELWELLVELNL